MSLERTARDTEGSLHMSLERHRNTHLCSKKSESSPRRCGGRRKGSRALRMVSTAMSAAGSQPSVRSACQ